MRYAKLFGNSVNSAFGILIYFSARQLKQKWYEISTTYFGLLLFFAHAISIQKIKQHQQKRIPSQHNMVVVFLKYWIRHGILQEKKHLYLADWVEFIFLFQQRIQKHRNILTKAWCCLLLLIMPKQGVHFLKLHDRIQPSLVYGTIFFIQLNPKKIWYIHPWFGIMHKAWQCYCKIKFLMRKNILQKWKRSWPTQLKGFNNLGNYQCVWYMCDCFQNFGWRN